MTSPGRVGPMISRRALCAGALGLWARRASAQDAPPRLAGAWEGKVLFAEGHEGQVALRVGPPDREGRCAVDYALTVQDEESAPTRRGQASLRLAGDAIVAAEWDGRPAQVDARLTGAGSHAEAALLGRFALPGAQTGATGVFLLWRYRAD